MFKKIRNKVLSGNARSVKAKKNIIASFLNKGIAIIITLLLVPVTINYLDVEQYGIWLTLSSIVAWIAYFDFGLGHGFRNRFAEAKAKGDIDLAKKYVTTSYVTLAIVFGSVLLVAEFVNPFLNWASILNVTISNNLLCNVVSILIVGVCSNLFLNIATIMLSADQKPALAAMISTLGQGGALIVIFLLTQFTESNMQYIAAALTWIPSLVIFIVSIILFSGKYKKYSPNIKFLDLKLVRNIIGLGGRFFLIQFSMLLIFQVVNIILSRVLGPTAVTEYNISYKYFSITQMAYNIILAPFWSAYTEAYTKGDYAWMKSIHTKLSKVWYILVAINVLMLACSPIAYNIWLGNSVTMSWTVSLAMCIYLSILSYSNMYMILLNGIGKVYMQMIIYIICAIFCVPISYYLCVWWGIAGVVTVLASVYLLQAIFAKYQLTLILSKRGYGIWLK